MTPVERHLLRARDLADHSYAEPLEVADLARAAGLSTAHFSRRFRDAFGVTPHGYLLTRRLERAAALLRTTAFTRTYGLAPTAYREAFPAAHDRVPVPECVVRAYGRPEKRSFREDPVIPAS